jgi:hypothetical protein
MYYCLYIVTFLCIARLEKCMYYIMMHLKLSDIFLKYFLINALQNKFR